MFTPAELSTAGSVDDAGVTRAADDGLGAAAAADSDATITAIGFPEASTVLGLGRIEDDGDLQPDVTWTGPTGFGGALAVTNGANGPEVWIGAADANLGRGAVYRFDSTGGGTTDDAASVISGQEPGDHLGTVVAACGDLSGDGLDDVAIGIPGYSASGVRLAGAVMFLRSEDFAATLTARDGETFIGDRAGDSAGAAIACDADLDGDGIPDLLWGSPLAGTDDAGELHWHSGRFFQTPSVRPPQRVAGLASRSWAGSALALADLDGDGHAEVAVGARGANDGDGEVYVYDGAALTEGALVVITRISPPGGDAGDHLGTTVGFADLDGGGVPDLLVGAPDRPVDTSYDAGLLSIWSGERYATWVAEGRVGVDDDGVLLGDEPFQRVGRVWTAKPQDVGADLVVATRTRATP